MRGLFGNMGENSIQILCFVSLISSLLRQLVIGCLQMMQFCNDQNTSSASVMIAHHNEEQQLSLSAWWYSLTWSLIHNNIHSWISRLNTPADHLLNLLSPLCTSSNLWEFSIQVFLGNIIIVCFKLCGNFRKFTFCCDNGKDHFRFEFESTWLALTEPWPQPHL